MVGLIQTRPVQIFSQIKKLCQLHGDYIDIQIRPYFQRVWKMSGELIYWVGGSKLTDIVGSHTGSV